MLACQAWLGVQNKAVCRQGLVVKSMLGGKVLGVVFPNFELDDQDLYCSVLHQAMQLSRHPLLGWSYLPTIKVITPLSTSLLREAKELCLVWDEKSFDESKAELERVMGFTPILDECEQSLVLTDLRTMDWEGTTHLPEEVEIFNRLVFKIRELEYSSVYDNPMLSLARLDTSDLEESTVRNIWTFQVLES